MLFFKRERWGASVPLQKPPQLALYETICIELHGAISKRYLVKAAVVAIAAVVAAAVAVAAISITVAAAVVVEVVVAAAALAVLVVQQ